MRIISGVQPVESIHRISNHMQRRRDKRNSYNRNIETSGSDAEPSEHFDTYIASALLPYQITTDGGVKKWPLISAGLHSK
jgi:hypothetical protein